MVNENKNSDPTAHIPTPEEVNTAYSELRSLNSSSSGIGNILVAALEATVEAGDLIPEDIDFENDIATHDPLPAKALYERVNEKLQQSRTEAEMQSDLGLLLYGDLLSRIGVSMRPSGAYIKDSQDAIVSVARLEPALQSPQLFSDYLTTLDEASAQTSPLLKDVANCIKKRIDSTVANPNGLEDLSSDERDALTGFGMDALRAWDQLESRYQELGVRNHSIQMLGHYPKYWGDNVLPEFIEASSHGYIELEGISVGFGPAEWALDMTPEHLSEKWNSAIDCMATTGIKNPVSDLYIAMRDHLSLSLEKSIESMEPSPQNEGYGEEYLQENLAVLKKAKQRFENQ